VWWESRATNVAKQINVVIEEFQYTMFEELNLERFLICCSASVHFLDGLLDIYVKE